MPPLRLENFDDASSSPMRGNEQKAQVPTETPVPAVPVDIEKEKLAAYEEGYRAGWDDAAREEAEEQSRIGADFARNLEDLGFTFYEARSHVMQALEPLLSGILKKVLPALVSETIGQTIVEELMPFAADAADTPIEVVVPPASRAVLEDLFAAVGTVPFRIVEEPTLADGQVHLRSATNERRIDMAGVVERISEKINGLYETNEKAFKHG